MSQRRLNRVCGKSIFTIFILGLNNRSLPLRKSFFLHLGSLGLVPGLQFVDFVHRGRLILWEDTIESLGIGPLSHLHLRFLVPGGANKDVPEASSSNSRSKRKRNSERMGVILDAEGLNSEGEPEKSTTRKPKKQKTASKPVAESDPEDEDFPRTVTVAESLPTKSVPTTTRKSKVKAKEKAKDKSTATPVPKGKKNKGKEKAVDSASQTIAPQVATVRDESSPSPEPQPLKPKAQAKRNRIYMFYESVATAADGKVVAGSKYWRCRLGNQKTLEITKGVNYNTSSSFSCDSRP
ncbi:hypothetical protein B0H14DRAFT_2610771 [Mycena olivaceomarginata]|nr:hypothetical protein B0H14DRAFT_2610771 [Mycena olivaceomarginata]